MKKRLILLFISILIIFGIVLFFSPIYSATNTSPSQNKDSIHVWIPTIINLIVLLIGLSVTFERGRGNLRKLEQRFQLYVESDREKMNEFIEEVCKWQEKHEKANNAAMERLDKKIEKVDGRNYAPDGRPVYAYRVELETLSQGQQELRKEWRKDGDRLRREIKDDMKSHFNGVKQMIETMMKEIRASIKEGRERKAG